MVSSLAAQLAKGASINAQFLASAGGRSNTTTESYLFSEKDASLQDLDSVLALAQNGVAQLTALIPELPSLSHNIFSEASRRLDRTIASPEEFAPLGKEISNVFRLISPYLLQPAAAKLVEWMVRRFRVNEFNQDEVLASFLPYHDSPIFAKMVSILHIKSRSIWAFLYPFKEAARPLPRTVLVTEMIRKQDLARFVISLLPTALDFGAHAVHRGLVAFSTGVIAEYITRNPEIDEGVIAFVLPACSKMLEPSEFPGAQDVALSGAILLAALSHKCRITSVALEAILSSITKAQAIMGDMRTVQTIVSVLSPQDTQPTLPSSVVKEIIRMPTATSVIIESTKWAGCEKTLIPLITRLLKKKWTSPQKTAVLTSLIATSTCPTGVIRHTCALVLRALADSPASADSEEMALERDLLVDIHQRRHSIFLEALNELQESMADDEMDVDGGERVQRLEQLVLSVSLNKLGLKDLADRALSDDEAYVAATSIDPSTRVAGVRHILRSLQFAFISEARDEDAVKYLTVLASLITNPAEDATVLEAVYKTAPEVLARVLLEPPISNGKLSTTPFYGIVDSISIATQQLPNGPDPSVSATAIRFHLNFFTSSFISEETAHVVLEKLVLPLLLFTKARANRASIAWEVVLDSQMGANEDLFRGCKEIVSGSAKDDMVALNEKISINFAENIIASSHFEIYTNLFIHLLRVPVPDHSARVLALLVLRALISRLSGEHQISVSRVIVEAVVHAIHLPLISKAAGTDFENSQQLWETARQGVVRPNAASPALAALLLLQIANITPPTVTLFWLEDPRSQANVDERGPAYVQLVRTLYGIINSARELSPLLRHMLLTLFVNVGDAVLLFLAGVWTSSLFLDPTVEIVDHANEAASIPALLHARAFLTANLNATPRRDFQVIFPAITIALQSPTRGVRVAAKSLIEALANLDKDADSIPLTTAKTTLVGAYAFDKVYKKSDSVQYLDPKEFAAHVKTVSEHGNQFVLDQGYLTIFNHEHLSKTSGEGKKEYARKQRVLWYLLSHAVSWNNLPCRFAILRSLQDTHDGSKLPMIFPLIQELAVSSNVLPSAESLRLLVEAYDKSASQLINDGGQPYWGMFVALARRCLAFESQLDCAKVVCEQGKRLFRHLQTSQKIEFVSLLINCGPTSPAVWSLTKSVLPAVLVGTEVVIPLLAQFKPATRTDDNRAQKRVRIDEATNFQNAILLLEGLTSTNIPGSVELVRALLDVLQAVCYRHVPSRSDIDYLEQLLISALESAVDALESNGASVVLQVDVLVRLISASDNPQTYSQALLLIAKMARFASESIIHTVMPIFTFIDKNVIHRDDEYSFRVIQQAISSIVPIMISHFSQSHADSLDLYIAAREFLLLFTEASTHVPYHRRNRFLNHFVKTLGAETFLAPVCMLLVESQSDSFGDESVTLGRRMESFSAPLSLLKHQEDNISLNVILNCIRECHRLVLQVSDWSVEQNVFLALIPTGKPASSHRRQQILALEYFVVDAWTQLQSKALQIEPAIFKAFVDEIIQRLLDIMKLQQRATSGETYMEGVAEVAALTLTAALKVIPVERFITAIQQVMSSRDETLVVTAMDLLSQRVDTISDTARDQISSSMTEIINHIGSLIELGTSAHLSLGAIKTLGAIAGSAIPAEQAVLANTVPSILKSGMESEGLLLEILPTLNALTLKVGPRLIPHLKAIIALCTSSMKLSPELVQDSIAVLSSALYTMPAFWGAELRTVITSVLEFKITAPPVVRARIDIFVAAVASGIPGSTLLPALIQMWDADPEPETFLDFFDLLERALDSAQRPHVLDSIRPLFVLFLEVFDLPSSTENVPKKYIASIEQQCIKAFITFVAKLSETSFTPLFRRLQDWAWNTEALSSSVGTLRRITMCRVMSGLLDTFKSIMSPYTTLLLPVISDVLEDYKKSVGHDSNLWFEIISLVDKTLTLDDGEPVWDDKQLATLSRCIVPQLAVLPTLPAAGRADLLPECIAHLANTMDREDQLKKLNLDVLMTTRSEDPRVRLLALRSAVEAWTIAGRQFAPFVTDTITFIHECAEDENDAVAKEARELKKITEGIAGPLGDR